MFQGCLLPDGYRCVSVWADSPVTCLTLLLSAGDEAALPPDGTKPNFTEKPVIRQSDDGTKIIFECRLIADPTPTIEWFFKESLVKQDSRHQQFLRSDKHTHLASLEILTVTAKDAGEYKLVAKNSRGQSFATLNLNYEEGKASVPSGKAPRFPKKPAIKQVGANLLLECVLEAQPLGTITWFHGSKVVVEGAKRKISRKELSKDTYILSLQIDDPEAVDGGNYRCNAVNDFGESNANIALNFQEEEEEEEVSEEEESSISGKHELRLIRGPVACPFLQFSPPPSLQKKPGASENSSSRSSKRRRRLQSKRRN